MRVSEMLLLIMALALLPFGVPVLFYLAEKSLTFFYWYCIMAFKVMAKVLP